MTVSAREYTTSTPTHGAALIADICATLPDCRLEWIVASSSGRASSISWPHNALLAELASGVLPRIGNDMWASRTLVPDAGTTLIRQRRRTASGILELLAPVKIFLIYSWSLSRIQNY